MAKRVNRWLFLVTAVVTSMLEFGLVFSFGALFVALLDTFHRDRSSTATVQSLLIGITLSCGVVSGTLITTLGLPLVTLLSSILAPLGFFASFFASSLEHLYITIGIISGAGISLGYFSTIVVVGRVFNGRQKVLCLAIQTAFNALAGVTYPYFLDWLLKLYGLRGTFLILSAVLCNSAVFFMLCFLNKELISNVNSESQPGNCDQKKISHADKRPCSPLLNLVRFLKQLMSKQYAFMLIAQLTAMAGLNGYIGLILDISIWKGLNDAQGLSSFIFFNISNVISRLMPGILKQIKGINSFVFPIASCLAGCGGLLLIYFGTTYVIYVIGTFLIGGAMGGNVAAAVVVVVQVIDPEQIPVGTGLLFSVAGAGSAAIGPIFGRLRDTSGSYGSVVLTVSVMQMIGTIFYMMALVSRRRHKLEAKTIDIPKSSTVFSVTVTKM